MILHIFTGGNFVYGFIDFIESNYEISNHFFFLIGFKKKPYKKNVHIYSSLLDVFKLIFLIYNSKKIIIHGLFSDKLVIFLLANFLVLKKCKWVVYGGDLYRRIFLKRSVALTLSEILRGLFVRRISSCVTYIHEDYFLLLKYYSAKIEMDYCFMYMSNIVKRGDVPSRHDDVLRVQVGNSADVTNNHIEVLSRLSFYKESKIKLYCPLSYGDAYYAKKVIEYGLSIYGDKFVPIVNYMCIDEYVDYLKSIDVAIFNHDFQQGMGNIINLLGLGKKVYMKSTVSQYKMFCNLGVIVYDIDKLDLKKISEKDSVRNIDVITSHFKYENLISQWREIFSV